MGNREAARGAISFPDAAILSVSDGGSILVPRAHDPSGLWQGSRALV